MKLHNRNAIVTGGSQGLGRAIVETFLREGANVLFCGRDQATLTAAEAEMKAGLSSAQRLAARPCDVSDEAEVARLFARADEFFDGPLHILVNNAGIYGPKGPTAGIDLKEWQRCLDINLTGTLLPCREAFHRFQAQGAGGKIINLSGGGATNPLPNLSAYAATKAAVVRLTETLAEEWREFRIDVNAVAPGALNTRLLDEVLEAGPEKVGADFYRRALEQQKQGGVPLNLGADLCVYLASAQSDGITGKLISAKWDDWATLHEHLDELNASDIYALRRIVPKDRGKTW